MNTWISTIIGTVLGYVAGGIVDHPKIGAAIGGVSGYVLGGGQMPKLPAGSDILQVPTTTITPGP